MNTTSVKLIDASRLLLAKFPDPDSDYKVGWNDALQAAYENEPEVQCRREERNG